MAKQNKWQGLVNAIYTGVLITDRYGDILYANEIGSVSFFL